MICSRGIALFMFVLVVAAATNAAPQNQDGDDVLAGPKVEEDASKGGRGGMIGPQAQARRRANDLPFDQWLAALRELDLSQAQQDAIRAINQEFQQAQRGYRESLDEEDQNAARQAREARQAGEQPSAEIRDRLRKIEENRPRSLPYQERIWDELTADQQERLKTRLAELREQAGERRQRRNRAGNQAAEPDEMMMDQAPPPPQLSPEGRETMPAGKQMDEARPRRARGEQRSAQLDEPGQRRLAFLLKHQSKSVKRPGREVSEDDRRFEFVEE